ncbi:MAG: ParB/RepB/Spo0J family partition protein [Actinomycetota bacterium]
MSARRGGLGKGLGALIPSGPPEPAGSGVRIVEELPVGAISPGRRQPRREFDAEGIAGLAASIRQVGVLQPVVVRPVGEGAYELVMGERRWRAAREAGLETIPALISETDDRQALQQALIENMHRRDLNAVEEAAAYQQLIGEGGLTHDELAEQLGVSRPAVSNALRLLDLPPAVHRLLVDRRLSAGHARALLGLPDAGSMERLALRVAAEGASVRETEALVRRHRSIVDTSPPRGRGRVPAPGMVELGERLSDELQTRVQVAMGTRKGRIVIECGSPADLDRITRRILGAEPCLPGDD